MLILFTPYTYLFLSLYFLVLLSIFSIRNFLIFWLFIEILILLFIGVAYTQFIHSYSQLITYFLFQTLGSFSILVIYLFGFKRLVIFRLFFKLGMFPFYSWYINVLYRFPSFILFLARTFHKLPPLYIFYLLVEERDIRLLLLGSLLTVLVSSIFIFYIYDLRYMLIVSSIGNNAFILLAVLTGSVFVFSLFYIIYRFTVFLLLSSFSSLTRHSYSFSLKFYSFGVFLLLLLLNLGSFPPFPGFISKFLVFWIRFSIYSEYASLFLLLIFINVLIMLSYVRVLLKYLTNVYSNQSSLILF